MNEKAFSEKLRRLLNEQGIRSVNLQNISSEPSCPDTNLLDSNSGREGFFELKVLRPDENRIHFQAGQTKWLYEREEAGGVAGLITLVLPRKKSQTPLLVCVRGKTARKIELSEIRGAEDILKLERMDKFSIPFPSGELGNAFRFFLNTHPCSPV